jgi:hypothetical protein
MVPCSTKQHAILHSTRTQMLPGPATGNSCLYLQPGTLSSNSPFRMARSIVQKTVVAHLRCGTITNTLYDKINIYHRKKYMDQYPTCPSLPAYTMGSMVASHAYLIATVSRALNEEGHCAVCTGQAGEDCLADILHRMHDCTLHDSILTSIKPEALRPQVV